MTWIAENRKGLPGFCTKVAVRVAGSRVHSASGSKRTASFGFSFSV